MGKGVCEKTISAMTSCVRAARQRAPGEGVGDAGVGRRSRRPAVPGGRMKAHAVHGEASNRLGLVSFRVIDYRSWMPRGEPGVDSGTGRGYEWEHRTLEWSQPSVTPG